MSAIARLSGMATTDCHRVCQIHIYQGKYCAQVGTKSVTAAPITPPPTRPRHQHHLLHSSPACPTATFMQKQKKQNLAVPTRPMHRCECRPQNSPTQWSPVPGPAATPLIPITEMEMVASESRSACTET